MKLRSEVTFLGAEEFAGYGSNAGKTFIALSFIDHYGEHNEKMRAKKITVRKDKLDSALSYRGMKSLDVMKKYELWEQDYKGNRKLSFSGIKPLQ